MTVSLSSPLLAVSVSGRVSAVTIATTKCDGHHIGKLWKIGWLAVGSSVNRRPGVTDGELGDGLDTRKLSAPRKSLACGNRPASSFARDSPFDSLGSGCGRLPPHGLCLDSPSPLRFQQIPRIAGQRSAEGLFVGLAQVPRDYAGERNLNGHIIPGGEHRTLASPTSRKRDTQETRRTVHRLHSRELQAAPTRLYRG